MRRLFGVGVLALLSGCATPEVPLPVAEATPPRAVLVTIRDVPALRSAPLLARLSAGNDAGVELVARMEDGRTVSVVQPDAAGLKPGDTIMLVEGPPSRITPAR